MWRRIALRICYHLWRGIIGTGSVGTRRLVMTRFFEEKRRAFGDIDIDHARKLFILMVWPCALKDEEGWLFQNVILVIGVTSDIIKYSLDGRNHAWMWRISYGLRKVSPGFRPAVKAFKLGKLWSHDCLGHWKLGLNSCSVWIGLQLSICLEETRRFAMTRFVFRWCSRWTAQHPQTWCQGEGLWSWIFYLCFFFVAFVMECFFVKHTLILSQSNLNITSAPCRELDQTGFYDKSIPLSTPNGNLLSLWQPFIGSKPRVSHVDVASQWSRELKFAKGLLILPSLWKIMTNLVCNLVLASILELFGNLSLAAGHRDASWPFPSEVVWQLEGLCGGPKCMFFKFFKIMFLMKVLRQDYSGNEDKILKREVAQKQVCRQLLKLLCSWGARFQWAERLLHENPLIMIPPRLHLILRVAFLTSPEEFVFSCFMGCCSKNIVARTV